MTEKNGSKYKTSYAPTYKAERPKVKLNTRIGLARHKALIAAERKEEAKAAVIRIPRKWQKHDREMEKMLEGCAI